MFSIWSFVEKIAVRQSITIKKWAKCLGKWIRWWKKWVFELARTKANTKSISA